MFQLNGERAAAAAGALHVGVVELEAGALERLDVVDGNSIEIHFAHLVDQHLEAVKFVHVVGAFVHLIFKRHPIAAARATAANNRDAEASRRRRLLREDLFYFGYCNRRKLYGHFFPPGITPAESRTKIPKSLYQIPSRASKLQSGPAPFPALPLPEMHRKHVKKGNFAPTSAKSALLYVHFRKKPHSGTL